MLIVDKLVQAENFSKGEELIAEFIIQLGERIEFYSAREIAKETYSSPATVLNLCKKIGINGYNNFKKQYLKEFKYINQQFGSVSANMPFDKNDNAVVIVNKITSLYLETINDTQSIMNFEHLKKSVFEIAKSRSVHLYSYGTALNSAESFKEKMIKIGKPVYISSNLNYQKYEVNTLSSDDFVIFISYTGETKSIIEMAKTCLRKGIPFLTITSFGGNSLCTISNLNLYISTRENLNRNIANFTSNLSINFILDLLFSNYFALDYEKNYKYKLASIEKFESNRSSTNQILIGDDEI
ncbi:MurR/RpiR family transcriptional regulator [Erysipelothrix anatis]|uniref:MurR/RpiR family transcriptional regulator n=1 Tax=Erysipelothrix anatis TaxID=2683713 RepID=UPI0014098622|nr:MurR/RpiR family transcriptional regulator [Erysipelothrix anatis]